MSIKHLVLISTFFLGLTIACNSTDEMETKSVLENTPKQTPPSEKKTSNTSKIVFIGQKDACPCTRKRIDEAWPVFQKTLAGYKGIDVQRLQIDVDEEEADRYDDMRSIMVPPGIYFLGKDGKLIDMIQGEVTETQIAAVLQK